MVLARESLSGKEYPTTNTMLALFSAAKNSSH